MGNFKMLLLGALFSLGVLSCLHANGQADLQIIDFNASSRPLVNPGKGWVVYGPSPKDHSKEALSVSSLAYHRFCWSQIEPEEGNFDWTPIDNAIEAWSDAGMQFAFGVMCESFHSSVRYNTPKWVYDAGVPSIEYDGIKVKDQVAPKQWDHPVFLQKLKSFIDAMGRRYDGDPRIAFIDIRSYGQWGEGHLFHLKGSEKLSHEGLEKHIQIHLDAFKRTRLFIPWGEAFFDPVYDWAMERGVGLRRDGILGNSNGSELVRCIGKVPSLGEWWGNYKEHAKKLGSWKYAWGDKLEDLILDDTVRGAFTYQNLGQYDSGDIFVQERRPFIDKLTNLMGYHFLLRELKLPRHVASGSSFEASFKWENRGLFIPCTVFAALLDKDGRIVDKCQVKVHPGKWAPGSLVSETSALKFTAPPGAYRLVIGLFSDPLRQSPDIKLGIECDLVDNWHVLGNLNVD